MKKIITGFFKYVFIFVKALFTGAVKGLIECILIAILVVLFALGIIDFVQI